MANTKTTNRRQYTDIVVIVLISICIVLVVTYQLQGAASTLMPAPEPTIARTQTNRPSGGFVPPTRAPEDFIGTLLPEPTATVPTPTDVSSGSDVVPGHVGAEASAEVEVDY